MMWPSWFLRRRTCSEKLPEQGASSSVSIAEVLDDLQNGRTPAVFQRGGDEGSAYAPPADDVELRESVEGAERQFEGLVSRWEQVDSAFKTAAVRLAQMMERIEGIHEQLTKAGLPVMVSPNFADDAQKAFGDQLTLVHAEYLALRREVLGLAMAIAPSAESY
jgi:hypothetical protein